MRCIVGYVCFEWEVLLMILGGEKIVYLKLFLDYIKLLGR